MHSTDILGTLLREIQAQGERSARLDARVSVIEQRAKLAAQDQRKDMLSKLRELRLEVKSLAKRLDTQPIALRQVMDTWWLRIAAIVALGLANIDLKEAITLVLQLK